MSGLEIDRVDARIREELLLEPQERLARQDEMLLTITSSAPRSAVYAGRVRPIGDVEELSSLPLTSYPMIDSAITRHGLKACVLAPPIHVFRTSGSTGEPKKMYYSEGDADRIALDLGALCRIAGVLPGEVGWNLGGALPNVSGILMERTSDLYGLEKLTTLLTKDSDLLPAMRRASKAERIEVVAGAALVLYFVGRAVREPAFLRDVVFRKLRRDYRLPGPLASMVARLYLLSVDTKGLQRALSGARTALTYAEPLTPYLQDLRESFPGTRFHDVLGSTENPVLAAQLDPDLKGLALLTHAMIAELADPAEVASGLESGGAVRGVPWHRWEKGMRGELVVTRPGECLPLVRYPTGDMVEVLDPEAWFKIDIDDGADAAFPLIKVLGRSVETLDFEVPDEMGSFLGNKIYAHHIHEALQRPHNIRWWEMYNIRGQPGRLCFLVIPDKEVADVGRFKKETMRHLLRECDDPHHTLQVGHELGRVDIVVTGVGAYGVVQQEIDRRSREGRSLGQLKPKRIHVVDGEEQFRTAIREKVEA